MNKPTYYFSVIEHSPQPIFYLTWLDNPDCQAHVIHDQTSFLIVFTHEFEAENFRDSLPNGSASWQIKKANLNSFETMDFYMDKKFVIAI